MFKKKNTFISIENDGDTVFFEIHWNKKDLEQINLFKKLLIMLNNGDLKEHIEKAILHYGDTNNDKDTAEQIVLAIQNIQISPERKYLQSLLVNNKRDPLISPTEVLNVFKNSIG